MMKIKKHKFIFVLSFIVLASIFAGIYADRYLVDKFSNKFPFLNKFFPQKKFIEATVEPRLNDSELSLVEIADSASKSVVTVSIKTAARNVIQFSPFGGFTQRTEEGEQSDIGSGFVVTSDGLIVTNKHVVSNTSASYKVITKDDKEYDVLSINRDPNNDIAVLKINAENLTPLVLGNSDNLKVGQTAIAIGTALGEFRHTVTTGVISGLGRGITAGSLYEGFVEKLDGVIQTDAAINPGNSGGPLLNSSGQVIGVNVAVAQGAQNIGFAIPINVVKESLNQFQKDGRFIGRPYLGVRYQMISKRTAVLNDLPQGAFVVEVVFGSPAEKAGLMPDDIITKLDGKEIKEENDISKIIKSKKVGEKVELEVYRNGETKNFEVTLSEYNQ